MDEKNYLLSFGFDTALDSFLGFSDWHVVRTCPSLDMTEFIDRFCEDHENRKRMDDAGVTLEHKNLPMPNPDRLMS